MSFWQRLKLLFSKQNQPSSSADEAHEREILHEVIQRSEQELAHYEAWLQSAHSQQMLYWLQGMYDHFRRTKRSCDENLDFLMIPSVNGFVIHYDPERWDCDDFQSLFDYLKNRLKEIGYWSHVSDVRAVQRGRHIDTMQRYFLKPPRQFDTQESPLDQHYGNVMISLNYCNERLCNLKFCATHYSDRQYKPPYDFAKLMETICTLPVAVDKK